jgi:hypothetical protein
MQQSTTYQFFDALLAAFTGAIGGWLLCSMDNVEGVREIRSDGIVMIGCWLLCCWLVRSFVVLIVVVFLARYDTGYRYLPV